jgi:crossover junction endodeoxyribonuclease RuvC
VLNVRSVLGTTRVLGIDPGSRYLGWGVLESGAAGVSHVAHGVLRLDPRERLEERLVELFARLSEALARHAPSAVAVEGVFSFRNARSALVLGHARGVALLAAARAGLPVFEYAPAEVKRAVGVGGAGAKEAVSRAVRGFLSLAELPRSDATDALAVALCHLHRTGSPIPQVPPSARRLGAAAFEARLRPALHPASRKAR